MYYLWFGHTFEPIVVIYVEYKCLSSFFDIKVCRVKGLPREVSQTIYMHWSSSSRLSNKKSTSKEETSAVLLKNDKIIKLKEKTYGLRF